MLSQEKC